MIQVQTIEDVYLAVDELCVELKAVEQSQLAAILHHRMHRVAWTTASELLEELRGILDNALNPADAALPGVLKQQIERILGVLRDQEDAVCKT